MFKKYSVYKTRDGRRVFIYHLNVGMKGEFRSMMGHLEGTLNQIQFNVNGDAIDPKEKNLDLVELISPDPYGKSL